MADRPHFKNGLVTKCFRINDIAGSSFITISSWPVQSNTRGTASSKDTLSRG